MTVKSKSNKKGGITPADKGAQAVKIDAKKATKTATDAPTATVGTSETKKSTEAKTAAPKSATTKTAKPDGKAKVAASAKISTTTIVYELLDKHGLEGTTFQMADEAVRKAKGQTGFNPKCYAWYRNHWRKLQKANG